MTPDPALTTYLASLYHTNTPGTARREEQIEREEKKYQIFMMQDLNNQRLI